MKKLPLEEQIKKYSIIVDVCEDFLIYKQLDQNTHDSILALRSWAKFELYCGCLANF